MTKVQSYCLCLSNEIGDQIVCVLLTKVGHIVCDRIMCVLITKMWQYYVCLIDKGVAI